MSIRSGAGIGSERNGRHEVCDHGTLLPPFDEARHERSFGLWRADGSPKPAVAVPADVLQSYAGTYRNDTVGLTVAVAATEKGLIGTAAGQPPLTLTPTAQDAFAAVEDANVRVTVVGQTPPQPARVKRAGGIVSNDRGWVADPHLRHDRRVVTRAHQRACQLFGVQVRIVVPEGANPGKVAAIQGMGAEVIFHGSKFEEAVEHCETLARRHGYRYVHSANEPHLIAGVGTHTLEVLLEQPDIEVVIVPLGLGSGAAGACIAAHGINPAVRVIAVQSEDSPAGYESWKQRALLTAPNRTFAEGLATGSAAELTQHVIREHLHDFILLSDDEIRQAIVWMIERAHTLAEGAGAAPVAAAYRMREELQGKKVALICSGGNCSLEHLRLALAI